MRRARRPQRRLQSRAAPEGKLLAAARCRPDPRRAPGRARVEDDRRAAFRKCGGRKFPHCFGSAPPSVPFPLRRRGLPCMRVLGRTCHPRGLRPSRRNLSRCSKARCCGTAVSIQSARMVVPKARSAPLAPRTLSVVQRLTLRVPEGGRKSSRALERCKPPLVSVEGGWRGQGAESTIKRPPHS